MAKEKKMPAIAGILIIVVLIIAILLVIFVFNKDNKEKLPQENNPVENTIPEVYSYIGKITAINGTDVIINAEAMKNKVDKDTDIKVIIDQNTKIQKVEVPREVIPGEKPQFERVDIEFKDLSLGDEITALSQTDVFGKTEFVAKKIEIILPR